MKINEEIKKDIKIMFIGMGIINLIVYLISLAFGFSLSMLLGFIIGYIYICWNMWMLSLSVSFSVGKSPSAAKKYMYGSYLIRYAVLFVLAGIAFKTRLFSPLGIILPLFYPKIVLGYISITGRR